MILQKAFFIDSVPFTKRIIDGTDSLGGSESACLGLARGLVARGHHVHIFATRLDPECVGLDHGGVAWHHAEDLYDVSSVVHWDVFTSLRMASVFQYPIRARLTLLWNQDMLVDEASKLYTMALMWQVDHVAYVSHYHRKQWEGVLPELAAMGLVVKNGYDPALVPADAVKDWKRIIHISRPERGLEPLLQMWPELKKRVPEAELRICRYQSMYDGEGGNVRAMCETFDRLTAQVEAEVGGITWLGSLGKAELYREIAEASVMWYPGIPTFAETSCVAAIEAQANGTPFVGSWKGALPETVPSGVLIPGSAFDAEYQAQSVAAVQRLMEGCRDQKRAYRDTQKAGRAHVEGYAYAAVAEQWETMLVQRFRERYHGQKIQVLRALLHEDDHTAAKIVAREIAEHGQHGEADVLEAEAALALCDRVIAGQEHSAEQYGEHAIPNPLAEWDANPRFHEVVPIFESATNLIDIACGNGSFALGLAKTYPTLTIVGVDYSAANIEKATHYAKEIGVADRVTFYHRAVWDLERQQMPAGCLDDIQKAHGPFDALFAGEILEHIADAPGFVDSLEAQVAPGGTVVFTVPNGPFVELMDKDMPVHKGHVHHFDRDDLTELFGLKADLHATYWRSGTTPRGHHVGHWIVRFSAHTGGPARPRDYAHRIVTQRPKVTLSVGLIVKNAELDLARCLESVWPIADEIVIGDTGSQDDTKAIAAKYHARIFDCPDVNEDPEGFAGARNRVLAHSRGDWFLWVDADEILLNGHMLWKYLDHNGGAFLGFQLHQTHLAIDAFPNHDKPVRIFQRRPDIRFYGCVHEQPQQGDSNGDIWPVLDIPGVDHGRNEAVIAHTGYLTEGVRRHKMVARNRSLLVKDQKVFPERRLGKLLWVREFSQMGQMAEEQQGIGTPTARHYYTQAIALYEQEFSDPTDKYHGLGRPFYETCLQRVASAMEFDLGLAGKVGGLPRDARAKNSRVWVRRLEDFERIVNHKLAEIRKQQTPPVVDVEPMTPPPAGARAEAMTA